MTARKLGLHCLINPVPLICVSLAISPVFYFLFPIRQVFENLRKDHPEQMKKIVAVAGDVTLPSFGLSNDDLQTLLDNVSVVFNSAATVKFDEELKTAVQLNVKGPRELLSICRKMKKLQVIFPNFRRITCPVLNE